LNNNRILLQNTTRPKLIAIIHVYMFLSLVVITQLYSTINWGLGWWGANTSIELMYIVIIFGDHILVDIIKRDYKKRELRVSFVCLSSAIEEYNTTYRGNYELKHDFLERYTHAHRRRSVF
jgi:hypothetical protein